MNILITGANGLLGRNMIQMLSLKHQVFAVVKSTNELKFELNNNISLIELDLINIDLELLPKSLDVIYYLAQSNRFREFPKGAEDMRKINIDAPLILVEFAIDNGVKKFIYASSGGVYTNPEKPVKEFFNINANEKLGFYLNSKLSAEMLLKNYALLFETFIIIRPFFMYGVGQNNNMLIPRLIQNIINNEEIRLNGKNGIKINPIYINDATKLVSKIVELSGEHIINIAGSEVVSLKELCIIIGKVVGKKPIFKYNQEKQNDLIADIVKMEEKLFSTQITIEKGIRKMLKSL
jgi:nucleoside-diphosphate-sugar epimerase